MEFPSEYRLLGSSPLALQTAATALGDACAVLYVPPEGFHETTVDFPVFGEEEAVLKEGCDALFLNGKTVHANELLAECPSLSAPFRDFRDALTGFLPDLVAGMSEERRFPLDEFRFSIQTIKSGGRTMLSPHNDYFRLVQATFSSSGAFTPLRVFKGNYRCDGTDGCIAEDGAASKTFPTRKMHSVSDGMWVDAQALCVHKVFALRPGIRLRAFAMLR